MKRGSFLKRLVGAGAGLALAPSLVGNEAKETFIDPESPAPSESINYHGMETIPIPDGFEQVGPTFELNGRSISCRNRKIRLHTSSEDPAKEIYSEEFREKLAKVLKSDGYTHIHVICASPIIYHPQKFTPSKGIFVVGHIDQTPTT